MNTNSASQDRDLSFEDAYTLLEEKVATLEQGGLSLEESILLFEQGMNLLNVCSELLSNAELKITNLQNMYSETNDISQHSVEEINED